MANSADLDEVAHYEPPHQNLHFLQIQLFSSLVLKELETHCTLCIAYERQTPIFLTFPDVFK